MTRALFRLRYLRAVRFGGGFEALILGGSKTATVRRRTRVAPRPGERVRLTTGGGVFVLATIGEHEPYEPSETLARRCGHDSADDLVREVRRLYRDADDLVVLPLLDIVAAGCLHSVLDEDEACEWCRWQAPNDGLRQGEMT